MKICLIGNSHASGVYSILRNIGSPLEVDFFLERATGTYGLRMAQASGADEITFDDVQLTRMARVNANRYDGFAIYSMGFSFGRCVQLYKDYAPDSYPNDKAKYLVSDEFLAAAVESILLESKAVRIMRALRAMSDKDIVLVPQPLPMEWAALGSHRRTLVFVDALQKDFIEHAYKLYMAVVEKLREEGFVVLDQPEDTLASKYFTLSTFGLADTTNHNPESHYSRGDYFHANKTYAGIVLKDLEAALGVGARECSV